MQHWPHSIWSKIKTLLGMEVTVRQSVIWLTAVLLMFLWFGFALWAYWQWKETAVSQERLMERNRIAVEMEVRGIFKTAQVFLLAARHWIYSHPNEPPLQNRQFVKMVRQFQDNTNGRIVVRLINQEGMSLIVSSGSAEISTDGRYLDYLGNMLHGSQKSESMSGKESSSSGGAAKVFIGQPYRGSITGRWGIPVGILLEGQVGDLAMVQAKVDLEILRERLAKRTFSESGAIVLLNKQGDLLANAPGPNWRRGNPVGSWEKLQAALMVSGSGILRNQRLDQQELWLAYGATTEFPLVVVVAESKNNIFADWYSTLWVVLALIVLTSLVAVLSARRALNLLGDLEESRHELELMAVTDSLTGLYNRRHFNKVAEAEWIRARRYNRPFSLIMFDIDLFKNVNDKPGWGHAAGDLVLVNMARSCHDVLRDNDMLCRLGGEEFAVMVPETDIYGALFLAERLRERVEVLVTNFKGSEIKVTISLGVAQSIAAEDSFAALERRADNALYNAKKSGRNHVKQAVARSEDMANEKGQINHVASVTASTLDGADQQRSD